MEKNQQNQAQSLKFKEAAREHGCDESEEAFNEKLRKLAENPPKKKDE